MTSNSLPNAFSLLSDLLKIDSPSGDEWCMSEFLRDFIKNNIPSANIFRVGQSLVAVRGTPKVALFAHIDTTGFTLGRNGALIPIGSPHPRAVDRLQIVGNPERVFEMNVESRRKTTLKEYDGAIPGERLVYAHRLVVDGPIVTTPYLDNRAGIWAAVTVLERCSNVAVAFTSGEELSGFGARVCARHLSENWRISTALICDITWDTDYVHIGKGPAISLRDSSVPNQRLVERVVEMAARSQFAYQTEIESAGGSDGAHIESGGHPIDWVFVGAPEKLPHSSTEAMDLNDLANMAELLRFLAENIVT